MREGAARGRTFARRTPWCSLRAHVPVLARPPRRCRRGLHAHRNRRRGRRAPGRRSHRGARGRLSGVHERRGLWARRQLLRVARGPVGCGDRVQLCCPGQACAVGADGRPSCESAGTCTVIEGSAAPDAARAADRSPVPAERQAVVGLRARCATYAPSPRSLLLSGGLSSAALPRFRRALSACARR